MRTSRARKVWRAFDSRDRADIAAQLEARRAADCPRCGSRLEVQPDTRFAAVLPIIIIASLAPAIAVMSA